MLAISFDLLKSVRIPERQMTKEFTLWIDAGEQELLEWSNSVFEAGGDDMSPGVHCGEAYVSVHREAETLEEAIRSAHITLAKAGLRVIRCEIDATQSAAMGIAS